MEWGRGILSVKLGKLCSLYFFITLLVLDFDFGFVILLLFVDPSVFLRLLGLDKLCRKIASCIIWSSCRVMKINLLDSIRGKPRLNDGRVSISFLNLISLDH